MPAPGGVLGAATVAIVVGTASSMSAAGGGEGPLIFMHIPKTGGMGIDYWLYNSFHPHCFWFGSDYINPPGGREVQRAARAVVDPRTMAMVGHLHYNDWKGKWATVVRDPVERIVSMYYAHKQYGSFPPCGLSLLEFAVTPPYAEAENGMVRRLAGGEVDLKLAKKHLTRFTYVHCTSNIGLFVERVSQDFILPHDVPFQTMNVNGAKPQEEIPGQVLAAIRKNNRYDIELFNFAVELSAIR